MSRMDAPGRPIISGYKEAIENILIEFPYVSLTIIALETNWNYSQCAESSKMR